MNFERPQAVCQDVRSNSYVRVEEFLVGAKVPQYPAGDWQCPAVPQIFDGSTSRTSWHLFGLIFFCSHLHGNNLTCNSQVICADLLWFGKSSWLRWIFKSKGEALCKLQRKLA